MAFLVPFSLDAQLVGPKLALGLDLDALDDAVDRRNNHEGHHRRNEQTTDDRNTHRLPHLRTLARTDCHWQHAKQGGQRGHKHRTQTAATGMYHGRDDALATFAKQVDVVDEHDTVLHNDRRTRGILEWIAYGVTHDGSLVACRTLAAEVAFLDILLGIVPRTTCIRHKYGKREARRKTSDKHPYALSGLEYESADEAYQKVVNQAGASLPRYDEVDQRLLDEAAGRIDPQYAGASIPNEKGIIDAPDDIQLSEHDTYVVDGVTYTNFPFLGMREGDRYIVDADCDGMPNAYEDEMGFDKNDPTDGAALAANGYTNVENYLNGIADGALQKSRYETSDYPITPGHDMADEVTYSFTTGRADGEAPKGGTLPFASQYTIPQNTSLYLDGYTLIGWTSQGKTYYIGDVITLQVRHR